MAYAQSTALINRPIDKVFQFVLDGENNRLWRPTVIEIKKSSNEPIGAGTVFIQRMRGPGGRKIEADYEITECVKEKKIVFNVLNGPYRAVGTFDFEVHKDGVKVTFTFRENTSLTEETEKGRHLQRVVDTIVNLKEYLNKESTFEEIW